MKRTVFLGLFIALFIAIGFSASAYAGDCVVVDGEKYCKRDASPAQVVMPATPQPPVVYYAPPPPVVYYYTPPVYYAPVVIFGGGHGRRR